MTDTEEKLEHLMDQLVAEVAEEYAHLLTPEALQEVSETIADLIVTDPDGRALLRQCLADPTPAASAMVTRETGVAAPRGKRAAKK